MAKKRAKKRAKKSNYKKSATERKKRTSFGRYALSQGTETFSPKKGNSEIQIIPYTVTIDNHPDGIPKGDLWFRFPVKVHFNVGVEEQSYICPKTFGLSCPICEDRKKELALAGNDEDLKKQANKLRPQDRELFNLIDLNDSDEENQFYDAALGNFGNLMDEEIDAGNEEYDTFYDPVEPYSLDVRYKQKSFAGTKYLEASKMDFEQAEDELKDEWLDNALNLDKIPILYSYEELERIHLGLDEDMPEKEDEPDTRKRVVRKKKSKAGKKSKKKSKAKKKPKQAEKQADEKAETKGVERCLGKGIFGKDFDSIDGCNDCNNDLWTACAEAHDQLEDK